MQRLEVSGALRPIYGSLGVERLISALDGGEWSTSNLALNWGRTPVTTEGAAVWTREKILRPCRSSNPRLCSL